MKIERTVASHVPSASSFGAMLRMGLAAALCALAVVAQHPAFAVPAGFTTSSSGDTERIFERTLPNGDRLRWKIKVDATATDTTVLAKSMADADDKVREESKQDIAIGNLKGVAWSCLGASELVGGAAKTRYRRIAGYALSSHPPFGLRVDLLASEARPAQSTLDASSSALAAWQKAVGGLDDTPPPDASGSRPVLGGQRKESVTGGGDLEMTVPAFWGRALLAYPDASDELFLGPATDVLKQLTVDTIGKEKDRLGPFVSVLRIRRDTFNDLLDAQLLDIATSLLADYVKSRADAGINLTIGDRTEGTLGTRVVVSAPFEESRASSTKHRGRVVFMLHKGILTVVTASHPEEGFDAGWPGIAAAFDTLIFTGPVEVPTPETTPTEPPPAEPTPAPPAIPSGKVALEEASADWLRDGRLSIPWSTPVSLPLPEGYSVLGRADNAAAASLVLLSPKPEDAADPLRTAVRILRVSFVEALAIDAPLERLAVMVQASLSDEANEGGLELDVGDVTWAPFAGVRGVRIAYTLRAGGRLARGRVGALADLGTVLLVDIRTEDADRDRTGVAGPSLLEAVTYDPKSATKRDAIGDYTYELPEGWKLDTDMNRGNGRDIFVTAPSGVAVRFQTAVQKRGELVDNPLLARITKGFLADGLKIVTAEEAQDARRWRVPGTKAALRVEGEGSVRTTALAHVRGDHLVFRILGVPKGYDGRDIALGWRVLQSLESPGDVTLSADPPNVKDGAVTRRVVFRREGIDAFHGDARAKTPRTRTLVLLPDGTAGYSTALDGRVDEWRGTYRIDAGMLYLDFKERGKRKYRITDIEETLAGSEPGDVLWRARSEESL